MDHGLELQAEKARNKELLEAISSALMVINLFSGWLNGRSKPVDYDSWSNGQNGVWSVSYAAREVARVTNSILKTSGLPWPPAPPKVERLHLKPTEALLYQDHLEKVVIENDKPAIEDTLVLCDKMLIALHEQLQVDVKWVSELAKACNQRLAEL